MIYTPPASAPAGFVGLLEEIDVRGFGFYGSVS